MELPPYPPTVNQQWNHALFEKRSRGSLAKQSSATLSIAAYGSPPAFASQTLSSSSTSSPPRSPPSLGAHPPSSPPEEAATAAADVSHDWDDHVLSSPETPLYLFQMHCP